MEGSKWLKSLTAEERKEIEDEIRKNLGLDSNKTKEEPIGKLTDDDIRKWANKDNRVVKQS